MGRISVFEKVDFYLITLLVYDRKFLFAPCLES